MIGRLIIDSQTLVSGATFTTPQSLRIKQQRRRLEAIFVECDMPDSVTLSAPTSESLGAAIGRIVLSVNDAAGSRNLVDAEGIALLDEWVGLGGTLPLKTNACIGTQLTTAQALRRVTYPVFIRHPQIEEPTGNLFSLPLYEVNDDPVLTITPGTATTVGTGFAFGANHRTRIHLCYRDTVGGGYIPTEIRSTNFDALASASRAEMEIASNGLLFSLLLQGYTSAAKTTRRALTGDADHSLELWYGREQIRKHSIHFGGDYPGYTNTPSPTVAAGANNFSLANLDGTAFFDLLDDQPMIGAYNVNSALNLTSIKAGGDVAKVILDKTHASGIFIRSTVRKALGGPVGLLQGA